MTAMTDFELVTAPTFTVGSHQLWLNRTWRIACRSIYRNRRVRGLSRPRAKDSAVNEVMEQHWYWKQRAS